MKRRPEDLYLDLMKQTLAFTLWPEPPIPVDAFSYERPPLVRVLISLISWILRPMQLQLMRKRSFTIDQRQEGHIWPGYADTMIGLKRLGNLQFCVEAAIREGIEGDLIETGVWRGGACIFMRAILAAYGIEDRKVYVADSFEGLPKPDAEKFPADKRDSFHIHRFLAVSQDEVENNFKRYGLLDTQVVFLKGWFKDTLPHAPIEKLAVLRLDGDMYGSTMEALVNLYPKLSKGGFCIIDDYALPGCKQAVDDFRTENGIYSEIKVVDWTGRYWRKE
ncbi:MAG: TylF/MycF family methyltransferase [Thermodesulfovibrionales bacterium]